MLPAKASSPDSNFTPTVIAVTAFSAHIPHNNTDTLQPTGGQLDKHIPGIHHVTAIAGDPQRNLDFYTGVLGLRMVKLTVNFDDPGTYHFYFGDEAGHPGTILTFFAWPGARRGRRGNGQAAAFAFSVPEGTMAYWRDRLREVSGLASASMSRFGQEIITFQDPDGMPVELVAEGAASGSPWEAGPVPPANAIRGFHGVTLWEAESAPTARLLTETMGFRLVGSEGDRTRYAADGDNHGRIVDLVNPPNDPAGQMGAGVIHHIAWRTPDDAQQLAWRASLAQVGASVTPVIDRQYFRSIYFREPGGVLFEIATDPPGFTRDEPLDRLGTSLKLPPQYEPSRAEIERSLPPIRLTRPASAKVGGETGTQ